MKEDISKFPLIAITEVLDMPSGDAYVVKGARTVEDILEYKWSHIAEGKFSYKDWDIRDWKQQRPVFIEQGERPTLCNGHHRTAMAHATGALFVHYTNDFTTGWDQG